MTQETTQELTLAQLQALADEAADSYDNMTEAVVGGQGSRLLPEGFALARLVEVVELGNQPQEFNGVAKDPAPTFRLGFALYGEGYQNDDGTPYLLRTFDIARSRNEKAGAYLLFKMMNWKGTKTHFAQLIGEAFLLNIINKAGKAQGAKVTSRINLKDVRPPIEPISKQPYPVPEARVSDFKLFMWEKPTIVGWNSLYIDGKRDDGKSKNFIQETILGATDFAGSPLELLLKTKGVAYTVPTPAPAPVGVAPQSVGAVPSPSPTVPVTVGTLPNVSTPVTGLNPGVSPVVTSVAVAEVTPVTPQVSVAPAVTTSAVAPATEVALPNVVAAPVVAAPLGNPAPTLVQPVNVPVGVPVPVAQPALPTA